jgi:hypothetical protein
LADNSSSEMSSRYRSGRVPDGSGVTTPTMKTWRLGVLRPELVFATSADVCSSVGAKGDPSWKRSGLR